MKGSTSILDQFGFPLAGNRRTPGTDFARNFSIDIPEILPATGFAPGVVTSLPMQVDEKAYNHIDDLWLEIPTLGVEAPIVGVPYADGEWDTSWLGSQAGWLRGTAFPTWTGNTGLTGHVYDASGLPGPFKDLGKLGWGQQVVIHFSGQRYVYEVRSVNFWIRPTDLHLLMQHEEYDWLTLITCRGYDEGNDHYRWRTVVRAVLVSIETDR